MEDIRETLTQLNGCEFIGTGSHEQYFYPDYYAYQPDYGDKIYLLAKMLHEFGYRFVTADEMR